MATNGQPTLSGQDLADIRRVLENCPGIEFSDWKYNRTEIIEGKTRYVVTIYGRLNRHTIYELGCAIESLPTHIEAELLRHRNFMVLHFW